MSGRRLLLIDNDPDFHRILHEQLSPYGFEIYLVEDIADALSEVRDVAPELVFIAVEEPDKAGYSLCNKAKKGPAKDIPVILTTRSVPQKGFNSHRKLKVHADEYIDKREAGLGEAVLDKVETLCGLGELSVVDDIDIPFEPIELDDLSLEIEDADDLLLEDDGEVDEIEFEVDEPEFSVEAEEPEGLVAQDSGGGVEPAADLPASQSPDDALDAIEETAPEASDGPAADDDFGEEKTRIAPPAMLVDDVVDFETDAAFAALTGSADVELDELAATPFDDPAAEEPPPAKPPAPAPAQEFLRPRPADDGELHTSAAPPEPKVLAEAAPESEVTAEARAKPEVASSPGVGAEAAAKPEALTVPAPGDEQEAQGIPDLGLEEVAELAREERSQPFDPSSLKRIDELERENERLRNEAGAGGSGGVSREREFLNLRELINKKERQVLDLQDEIATKERAILDGKDHLRQLEHAKQTGEQKNLQLEQQLLELQESRSSIEKSLAAAQKAVTESGAANQQLASEVAAAKASAAALSEELAQAKASSEAELAELSKAKQHALDALAQEHEAAMEQLTASLSETKDAERAKAVEEATRTAEKQSSAAIEALRAELGQAHEGVLEEQRTAHLAAVAAADATAVGKLEEATAEHNRVLAEKQSELDAAKASAAERIAALEKQLEVDRQALKDQHAGQLARLARERDEAIEAAGLEQQEALATAAADHERLLAEAADDNARALAAAEADKKSALADAERAKQIALTAAADERAAAENALQERFESDKNALETSHAESVASAEQKTGELETALQSARETIESREAGIAELEANVAANTAAHEAALAAEQETVAKRDKRISELKRDIAELETQNGAYQEQVLMAYQKIRGDEATVGKAKKAIAIALTLLDEQISDMSEPGEQQGAAESADAD